MNGLSGVMRRLAAGAALALLAACAAPTAQPPTALPASATPAPTALPSATPEVAGIPGVYLGTYHGTRSGSLKLFEQIGKGIAISALYLDWNSGFNPGLYNANARLGRISFITWEYKPGTGGRMRGYDGKALEAILDGVHDDYLRTWAEGVRDFGRPIFIRWSHEMNGDWYPWGGPNNGGGTLDGYGDPTAADGPERYAAAYRYIHDLFTAAGAENAVWVWCPNAPFGAMEAAYGPWNTAASYYPGDEYVDWLCMDGYNWGSSAFGQQFNSTWTSFDGIFGDSYRQLQAINADKPIIIGEFASTEDGGDKAAWIREAYAGLRADYPQIRAAIWFHTNKETDWRIDSSPASLAAFREAVANDYWLDEWPGLLDE